MAAAYQRLGRKLEQRTQVSQQEVQTYRTQNLLWEGTIHDLTGSLTKMLMLMDRYLKFFFLHCFLGLSKFVRPFSPVPYLYQL